LRGARRCIEPGGRVRRDPRPKRTPRYAAAAGSGARIPPGSRLAALEAESLSTAIYEREGLLLSRVRHRNYYNIRRIGESILDKNPPRYLVDAGGIRRIRHVLERTDLSLLGLRQTHEDPNDRPVLASPRPYDPV